MVGREQGFRSTEKGKGPDCRAPLVFRKWVWSAVGRGERTDGDDGGGDANVDAADESLDTPQLPFTHEPSRKQPRDRLITH